MCVCVVHPTPKTFRQIANPLRQPLGTLDALTFDLDLIVTPEDARVHEQLRRMHAEIAPADPVLRDGWCALRAYFLSHGDWVLAGVPSRGAAGCVPLASGT
jgi:hypothetical protein